MAGFGAITKGILPMMTGGAFSLALPDEAEGATYPGFVKQFPKLVTSEGRKELMKNGLLDESGRMYVGTLEPEVFDALRRRDKNIMDDNVWISRHAADRRLVEGVKPEDLVRWIADLVDNNSTKVFPNFPTRFPQPDHAKWMLAGRNGNSYTTAPIRAGDFGDVEL